MDMRALRVGCLHPAAPVGDGHLVLDATTFANSMVGGHVDAGANTQQPATPSVRDADAHPNSAQFDEVETLVVTTWGIKTPLDEIARDGTACELSSLVGIQNGKTAVSNP